MLLEKIIYKKELFAIILRKKNQFKKYVKRLLTNPEVSAIKGN